MPGSPSEVRTFLQRRLSLFLGFMAALHGLGATVGLIGLLATTPAQAVQGLRLGKSLLLEVQPLLLFGMWLACRRGERSMTWLWGADTAATLLQSLFLATAMVGAAPLPPFTGTGAVLVMVFSWVLVARAAAVPSTASRTAVLGLLASVPIVAGAYLLFRLSHLASAPEYDLFRVALPPPGRAVFWMAQFCLAATALSSFVSYVIYGLQRAVQKARQLGQYTLEAKIGEGGMGVVYRGRHALLRRPTALKLLQPGLATGEVLARFEREVQLTSQLTHPNTVAIYDYGRTPENVFYYAMEYIDGVDLEALVQADGRLPPARVRHVLRQLGGALEEAHRSGLVHRDVKPSNVMLCERGLIPDFVKVLDFGLARQLDLEPGLQTQAGQIAGTPHYMAPEQIRGEALDGRSDLYAVGALGYFLLTSRPVFFARTAVEICAHHLHSPVDPPSVHLPAPVPAGLEALILSCLSKDPARRPASAGQLVAALDACSDVPSWSAEEARGWWSERRRLKGAPARERSAGSDSLLTVDLVGREGPPTTLRAVAPS